MAAPKMTKNQMRRAKKKEQKKAAKEVREKSFALTFKHHCAITLLTQPQAPEVTETKPEEEAEAEPQTDTKAEPVIETVIVEAPEDEDDPAFAVYRDIFSKFGASLEQDNVQKEANAGNTGDILYSDDDIPDEDDEKPKMSKKKRKQLNKLSVAELKALARIPEVVEWQDVSSNDPRLLVQIKSQRNVVPVPTHWSLKREYLSSKRGIEKSAFRLPQFIAETGIAEMRDAVLEKQAEQSLKSKQRERVAPKMGRLDIDYQKLYDAFFRFQTKPELTRFGEVYYEGKESEVDYQDFRAGDLTETTREALGMPAGAPPPWLINQQRFGPPPSYPSLKIPGLNAPPPPGGSWGFHPGGWGKPPVDEFNRPLYGGDVFGLTTQTSATSTFNNQTHSGEPIERTLWGELQPPEEESESEEEEDDSDEEASEAESDPEPAQSDPRGLETPSGYSTTVPDDEELDLRKQQRRGYETEESSGPRSAYTVLPERQVRAEGFFGSDRAYDVSAAQRAGMPVLGEEDSSRKRKKPGDVDVAIDIDSLNQSGGLSKDELRQRYEASSRQEGIGAQWQHDEDLNDMIAEQANESRKKQRLESERRKQR